MLNQSYLENTMDKIKDLGVKIGTLEEVEWTTIKTNQEKTIRDSIINIDVAKLVLELAIKKIAEEEKK